jgi:hypothetical protein
MIEALILAHWLYSHECFDNQHCRPVPCDEIVDLGDGWRWHERYFSRAMLRSSPDGACHICTSILPLCIYLPPRV